MSLKSLLREIIEQDRGLILEAADIAKDRRKDLITEWRLSSAPESVIDAFTNPVDDTAERVQFAIALESPYGPSTALNMLLADYWWMQISPMLDKAITEVHEELNIDPPEPLEPVEDFEKWASRFTWKEFAA